MKTMIVEFTNYDECINKILINLKAVDNIPRNKKILIKPNLVLDSPPPVTTPVEICEAIIKWLQKNNYSNICIAEGTGSLEYETGHVFDKLGYTELANNYNIPLIDLNEEKTIRLENNSNKIFKEFYMPEIALNTYIISVPVLKAHSLAKVTGSLKNMMGFAPPSHYQCGGSWKKSFFHRKMHESIVELNGFRTPDLSIIDAVIGLAEYHLGGRECNPHVNKIIGGYDPVLVDRVAAGLLKFNWQDIDYLC